MIDATQALQLCTGFAQIVARPGYQAEINEGAERLARGQYFGD